jgi:hypothetical protein
LEKGGQYVLNFDPGFESGPKTINEWILLMNKHYFTKSELTSWICNKLTAKLFVRDVAGAKYVARLFGAFENLDEVFQPKFWRRLPQKFVVKGVLGSYGRFVRIVDKNNPKSIEAIHEMVNPKTSRVSKERFIVEEFLPSSIEGCTIPDFKFFCSFGKILFVAVGYGPAKPGQILVSEKRKSLYLVPSWHLADVTYCDRTVAIVEKPKKLDEMMEVASKLSNRFPFIRIDLYVTNDEKGRLVVKVGELTTLPAWGCGVFNPPWFDLLAGALIPPMNLADVNRLIDRDFVDVQNWKQKLRRSAAVISDVVMPGFVCTPHIIFDAPPRSSRHRL